MTLQDFEKCLTVIVLVMLIPLTTCSKCSADRQELVSTVKCRFDVNLNQTRRSFLIEYMHHAYDNIPQRILVCDWPEGKLYCSRNEGDFTITSNGTLVTQVVQNYVLKTFDGNFTCRLVGDAVEGDLSQHDCVTGFGELKPSNHTPESSLGENKGVCLESDQWEFNKLAEVLVAIIVLIVAIIGLSLLLRRVLTGCCRRCRVTGQSLGDASQVRGTLHSSGAPPRGMAPTLRAVRQGTRSVRREEPCWAPHPGKRRCHKIMQPRDVVHYVGEPIKLLMKNVTSTDTHEDTDV